jgi:hypothetical protein
MVLLELAISNYEQHADFVAASLPLTTLFSATQQPAFATRLVSSGASAKTV